MKNTRNLAAMVGLSVMLFALGVTGAKAQQSQGLSVTDFGGTFTLPHDAVWGKMTLPAGDYSLYYGQLSDGGIKVVEVVGKTEGSPHGFILAQMPNPTSAMKNGIVCVREGNSLVVRALEMSAIGESVNFRLPHGARLTARNANHNGYMQLAEAPMLIERIPVTLNAK
jgi:hypothetical protein